MATKERCLESSIFKGLERDFDTVIKRAWAKLAQSCDRSDLLEGWQFHHAVDTARGSVHVFA